MVSRAIVGGIVFAAWIAACACGAEAADLSPAPRRAPVVAPTPSVPPVYDWTGFYVGGDVGAGFAASSWRDPFTGTGNNVFNSRGGFLGGAQAGGNIQLNQLVLGIEGDFSWMSLNGSGTDSIGNTIRTNTQWTSTVTGRAGVAFDRLLLYGKGGLALAQDQSSLTDLAGNTASTRLLRTGWTVGFGLEYGLSRNWSTKIEYDYLSFGSQPLSLTTPSLGAVTPNASLNLQEVKAGLNFRFGAP
jgi:outer membrane immunogenic protein